MPTSDPSAVPGAGGAASARRLGPRLLPRFGEPKTTKNRVHLDVKAGGAVPDAERRARIEAVGNQLVAAGGSIYRRVDNDEGFWLIMQDPEGNEFCVN